MATRNLDNTRWKSAQRLELAFWRRWKTLPAYRGLDIPAYWRGELVHFGAGPEIFAGRRVLDLGCGPEGLIHYLPGPCERIRVDPLLPQYADRQPLAEPRLSICAMGEALPLASASVDLAICFNALDHMLDPAAALEELARVLKPGATALLMIHTFPPWLRPVWGMDRMHPHHFTAARFLAMVTRHFAVRRRHTAKRRFALPAGAWLSPAAWKYHAAGAVVSATYLRVERP